jgi:hypothetical protein
MNISQKDLGEEIISKLQELNELLDRLLEDRENEKES